MGVCYGRVYYHARAHQGKGSRDGGDQEGVPADVCVLPESLLPALGNIGGDMWIALPLAMSLSGYHIGTTTVLLWWKVDTPIKQEKRDKEKVVGNRDNLKIPGIGMLVFPFVCNIIYIYSMCDI